MIIDDDQNNQAKDQRDLENEDVKDAIPSQSNDQFAGETNPGTGGSAPEGVVENLDKDLSESGIRNDDQGPRELDFDRDMENDKQDQWES